MKTMRTDWLVVAALLTLSGCIHASRLHFTPEAYREMGRRYGAAMLQLLGHKAAGPR
jgi:hypothetical protein